MSNNILNDIEQAIYHFANANGDDSLVIKFSPQGYNECKSQKMASCFFSIHIGEKPHDKRFAGYPYEVVNGQVGSFKIERCDSNE